MANRLNNLYAVCSGAKGIGKTWLAAALCHALGLMKQKVLFFDADCGLENIVYQLGITSTVPYTELLNGGRTLNNTAVHFEKGRFDIIASKPGDMALNAAPAGRAQILASDLLYFSKHYDYTLVDCSNDNPLVANILLNACRAAVIIMDADPASLTAAYRKLEELKKLNGRALFHIVINRAFSHEEGSRIFKTLLKAAKEYINVDLNLLGIIRQDARIRDVVINQMPLLSRYPQCEGAQDVLLIARRILEEFENGV